MRFLTCFTPLRARKSSNLWALQEIIYAVSQWHLLGVLLAPRTGIMRPLCLGSTQKADKGGSVPPVLPNVTSQHRQSKWLKYQSSAQCDLIPENSADGEENDDICAQSVFGMLLGDTGEGRARNPSAPSSAPLLPARSSPGECSRAANSSHPGLVSEGKVLSLHLRQTPLAAATQKVLSHLSCHAGAGDSQVCNCSSKHSYH